MKNVARRSVRKSEPVPTGHAPVAAVSAPFPAWLMAVLLAAVTVATFWPALRNDFVDYDDNLYVTANVHVQSGLTMENLRWACVNPVAGNWHPVTVWSHMMDCQLFGLKPWGHHLTSVWWHALNTALVFLLFRNLTGAFWRSAMVAALFGLHPLHVESVAWIAERKDVLSTFFGLLSLILYARYASQSKIQILKSKVYYALALLFFALGLMSKPMLVTWPLVMLLLDFWPLQRFDVLTLHRLFLEKIPFFALAAIASVVTFLVQKQEGFLMAAGSLSLGGRAGNALISYCRYLLKLFWPADLAVFYPHPGHWPLAMVLLAGAFMLGVSALLFVNRRRYPFRLVGWLWYCGTLVPVIGLVQMGQQAMADRYAYIPSLGILLLTVWGICELAASSRSRRALLLGAGLPVLVACALLTRQQLKYWKDTEALFRHALDVTQDNCLAHLTLGSALSDKGQFDDAIREFQEAIRLRPDYVPAHDDLGVALVETGQIAAGISQHREAIRLKPDYAKAHSNLGFALIQNGNIDEAIGELHEAIRLKTDFPEAHSNLGMALSRKGDLDEAIREFHDAVRLKPGFAEARNNLGTAFLKKGRMDEAIAEFQEAVRAKPEFPEAHFNLGTSLARKGLMDQAVGEFQEAIRLKPDFAEARRNLALALASMNPPANR